MKPPSKETEELGRNAFFAFYKIYKETKEKSPFCAFLLLLSIPFGFFISFYILPYFGI